MKKSAFISDIIFAFFITFLFSICLFRYHRLALWTAFLLATLCGSLASGAVAAFLQHKRKHHFLKKSEEQTKQKLSLHLALLSDEQKTVFFENLFSTEEMSVRRFGKLRIITNDAFYFLKFSLAPVHADDILAYARIKTNKQKILLCLDIDNDARLLCKQLQIEIHTAEDVYVLIKEHDALPETYLGSETKLDKQNRRRKLWFAKKNCKRFLLSGSLLLITSFITPFAYYYLVMGCILFIIAACVRIFGYE